MAVDARMHALRDKHAHLEANLKEEMMRPLPDSDELTRIKQEKLHIKEELERLNHMNHFMANAE